MSKFTLNICMKIAFVGDSFCANTGDYPCPTYPYLLALEFNVEIVLHGYVGNPLFHSYEELLTIVDIADYIIFCITDTTRLPNKHGLPMCIGSIMSHSDIITRSWPEAFDIPKSALKRIVQSASNYYEDIVSYEFHKIAQKGLLMQIDELMLQKEKKCIWFPCYNDSMQGYVPKSGPTADINLRTISNLEIKHLSVKEQINSGVNDSRANHFSSKNNINMSNLIIDIINSNDFTPREIKMENYFEVLRC